MTKVTHTELAKVAVPWTTVKEIMAAISARASLTQEKTDV